MSALSYDSLDLYLKEIGRRPLLTRAEEIRLAKRVEAGDPEARERMIEANLRLVVAMAKPFTGRGVDLLDLIQEGTIGLMRAVDRYDWRRGTKFSTYAAWWIRHGITEALGNARPIRVPGPLMTRAWAVRRTERELAAELGRAASAAEVAFELDLTVDQVNEARAVLQPVSSLEEPVAEDGDGARIDSIADASTPDPLEGLVDEAIGNEFTSRLSLLPERGRWVIELRFGLHDGEPRTADDVAAELGVTRERVRQIELHALRKLGAGSRPVSELRRAA